MQAISPSGHSQDSNQRVALASVENISAISIIETPRR